MRKEQFEFTDKEVELIKSKIKEFDLSKRELKTAYECIEAGDFFIDISGHLVIGFGSKLMPFILYDFLDSLKKSMGGD